MKTSSFKNRFFFSVIANVLRAGITFLTGLVLAKGLAPSGYGELTFLLGSFTAIRALLDMGTSSAFYTFISQYKQDIRFYFLYFSWLVLQLTFTILLVLFIFPQKFVDILWIHHSQTMILLALLASFFQQSLWPTVVQIGESGRNTIKIQLLNLFIIIINFIVVLIFFNFKIITANNVLIALILSYFTGVLISYFILNNSNNEIKIKFMFKDVIIAYYKYCKPLFFLSIIACCYQFGDRWLLQKFGGSDQQGFYQVSAQFAAVSLLATTSITHIFWKEMAEASALCDVFRMSELYRLVSRGLLLFGAFFACFMVPWAEQVVRVLLGDAYINAWPVLAIMFIYPIHQSLGQVNAAMFMASGQTRIYTIVGGIGMLVSIPVTYFLLAPSENILVTGVGLGAIGLSIKMVVENFISVNTQAWIIARIHKWKYQWGYQVMSVISLLTVSFCTKFMICYIFPSVCNTSSLLHIGPIVVLSACVYSILATIIIWKFPIIAGFDISDLKRFKSSILSIFQ